MKFTNSGKGYSNQLAVSYIVYMMAGSYFHKSSCRNTMEEKHLYMHYAEMPRQKQLTTETEVIKSMNRLCDEFLSCIRTLKCEIHFKQSEGDYRVLFETGGFESVEAVIDAAGHFQIRSNW